MIVREIKGIFMKTKIDMSYKFTSDEEPTDEQLAQLMHEVAVEAKQQAMETNKKLLNDIKQAIAAALVLQNHLEENKP